MFATAIHFHRRLIFAGKAGAYQSREPYKTPLGLPVNIRLGWKWMAVTNTLAYYDTATIMSLKSV
jgi:hypothetical protein